MDKEKFEEDIKKVLKDHGFVSEGMRQIEIDLEIGARTSVRVIV